MDFRQKVLWSVPNTVKSGFQAFTYKRKKDIRLPELSNAEDELGEGTWNPDNGPHKRSNWYQLHRTNQLVNYIFRNFLK